MRHAEPGDGAGDADDRDSAEITDGDAIYCDILKTAPSRILLCENCACWGYRLFRSYFSGATTGFRSVG